jgi:hypothetical protein
LFLQSEAANHLSNVTVNCYPIWDPTTTTTTTTTTTKSTTTSSSSSTTNSLTPSPSIATNTSKPSNGVHQSSSATSTQKMNNAEHQTGPMPSIVIVLQVIFRSDFCTELMMSFVMESAFNFELSIQSLSD